MPLREDILNPIPGENPGGVDLRYDPVYEKLKEARREDDEFVQGAWAHERKVADHPLVIRLASETVATRSKDIQIAVWLTESLLKKEGFGGFREGLDLCRGLIEKFWDHLQPRDQEDDDVELRAAPLDSISTKMIDPVKRIALNRAGHAWFQLNEARTVVGYEKDRTGDAKKLREKLISKEGKLAPEDFDKSFNETPKAFYATMEKNLDACLASLQALGKVCDEKFGSNGPSFTKLNQALVEVRHSVHGLLEKKRETEPDPVEEVAAEQPVDGAGDTPDGAASPAAGGPRLLMVSGPQEPADRRQAIEQVAASAAMLRRREPGNPAPYLMMRGLRWGELRFAVERKDAAMLEAPPTELRQSVKMLALQGKWKELLEAAEAVMALPCSRGWLDLQRFVIEACVALGSDYDSIARAIRTELRSLVRDVPQIISTTLLDDTPAANPETQAWLRELMAEPNATAPPSAPGLTVNGDGIGWQKKYVDAYQLAKEAVSAGNQGGAIEIMQREVEAQRSGRGRFLRRLQLVELCLSTGKEAVAQPILEDMLAAIDAHKLEDWEERDMVAAALVSIVKASKRIQGDAKEKAKMFDRLCRLNPAKALEI
jgi:type VI secretion system protein ImpA